MSKISKGVRAFGIYFIVYSCGMFLERVGSILYHLIQNRIMATAPSSQTDYYHRNEIFLYSTFDAIVDFIGLGLAIFVFFAALRILKISNRILTSIKVICIVGISYNIIAIIKDVIKILNYPANLEWRSWLLAGGIATCILSICFWCFVFYFFNRTTIKEQFATV
ncbi:MAG: hypothetical protein A2984_00150 [Omnitrophica WOR_2 bacterium RIFCSPLOWO2_01_FULL_41_12]|nr:MAG: hypothetical protein A2984_00150 [Omnitrophica WOR_2 bacterium RIFCSPLOWO2_01_FULL_41_12]